MNATPLSAPIKNPWPAAKRWSVTLALGTILFTGCVQPQQSVRGPTSREHADVKAFLGESRFEDQTIFTGERFPNVVVTTDGTVLAVWGGIARENRGQLRVRRSEDGGATWGPDITVAKPGFHGGGAIVDERSGDVLVFTEAGHPPAPLSIYRSQDQGRTWALQPTVIQPDENGRVPSMHMNERGITLRRGPHAGRLLRPSRSYGAGNGREHWNTHYTNAIYSDDGGLTWRTSRPFPALGTGEATLAELTDGRIYYNSRRHLSTDGRDPRRRHIAWSDDGGHSWKDLTVSAELPDGEQDRDYGLMAGLVRLPVANRDVLIFSNIESNDSRRRGTVWASFDGGVTWPVKRLVQEGEFAYSSLAVGAPGTASEGWIYLLYEHPGEGGTTGRMIRFNLAWLLNGKDVAAYLPSPASR
jgi:sialidase-1